jgi:glycosyltransferase involved in cell wall biosynthesis
MPTEAGNGVQITTPASEAVEALQPRAEVPWVIVAGGFHSFGGMDRANAALARYLLGEEREVHLVAHDIEETLRTNPRARIHLVPRYAGSFLIGEFKLDRCARRVAANAAADSRGAHVVVNGGNCPWPDINWVHCVHRAWKASDLRAPRWFKIKNRADRWLARCREDIALRRARVVIANSERTRRDLINLLSLNPDRVHRIYPGVDPELRSPTPLERAHARDALGVPRDSLIAAFVGTLGYDCNKGFDTLLSAWTELARNLDWDVQLLVAGGGRGSGRWQNVIAELGISSRVRMLGFSDQVYKLLAAADLLVSPVRYEGYGLNVLEALCRDVPAMVSANAGVAEHYPLELRELLIDDPNDYRTLAGKLRMWRNTIDYWQQRVRPLARRLRQHTWTEMARQFVALAD